MKVLRVSLLVLGVLLLQSQVNAQTFFSANITHAQEPGVAGLTPPTASTGGPRPLAFGTATFTLNAAMTQLSFIATIFNIDVTGNQTPGDTNDNLLNAHIHASPTAFPGTNGAVVWGFFGSPLNDNNPNDSSLVPFATGVGGTFSGIWNIPEGNGTTLTAQLANILQGSSYINFHTGQFTGGEIRGQLIVPEGGSTAVLLGAALAALFFWHGRTRKAATA